MENTYELNNIDENFGKKNPQLNYEKKYSAKQKFFAELIGTTILIFVIELFETFMYQYSRYYEYSSTNIIYQGNLILIPITFIFGKISGAHFNPAISLAKFLRKKIIFSELGYYIGAQILGSFIGSLFVFLCIQGKIENMYYLYKQISKIDEVEEYLILLAFDVFYTFIYVLVFFATNTKRNKNWALSGFIIGITFYIFSTFNYLTVLNPMRRFFLNIIGAIKLKGNIGIILVEFFGPFIGAIAAGFMSILFE